MTPSSYRAWLRLCLSFLLLCPQVPALLSRSPTLISNPFFALRDAYITTNSSLHTRSDFSDELCGTTAASILVSGTTLCVTTSLIQIPPPASAPCSSPTRFTEQPCSSCLVLAQRALMAKPFAWHGVGMQLTSAIRGPCWRSTWAAASTEPSTSPSTRRHSGLPCPQCEAASCRIHAAGRTSHATLATTSKTCTCRGTITL